MAVIDLKLNKEPEFPLEAESISPNAFAGKKAADIKKLPYRDNSFDLVTISFATRNINVNQEKLVISFKEFFRVLTPNGRFINLETSQPPFSPFKKMFHFFIKLFVKSIGSRISGSKTAYAYLSKTIPRFYTAEQLAEILRTAGFGKVSFQRMMFGAAAIHQAWKGKATR